MELKSVGKTTLYHQDIRLNRTFMELKFYGMRVYKKALGVLIEPLWNWNRIEDKVSERSEVS